MKVERYKCKHWGPKYPMFVCLTFEDYDEICKWMYKNDVKHHLWSPVGNYVFDVRDKAEWFILRWM